jgi:hypothetical protein
VGATLDGKTPLPLMTKGDIFIKCRGQRHGSRGRMSDITSVLHQSVAINAKGGYFLLRLVVIDVNP